MVYDLNLTDFTVRSSKSWLAYAGMSAFDESTVTLSVVSADGTGRTVYLTDVVFTLTAVFRVHLETHFTSVQVIQLSEANKA